MYITILHVNVYCIYNVNYKYIVYTTYKGFRIFMCPIVLAVCIEFWDSSASDSLIIACHQ